MVVLWNNICIWNNIVYCIANHRVSVYETIWVWINTYENTIFRGMNIHKSQLFWCELQGYKVLTHCHIYIYIYIFVCVYYIHGHHMYLYIYMCVFYFYVYTHILWYKHVWYIYVLICIVCNIYTCGCGSNYMTSIRTLDPQAIHTHNPIIHL